MSQCCSLSRARNGLFPADACVATRGSGAELAAQVKAQAEAVFHALRQSRISYVSSIYTFGNYPGETQRIRLPRETLVPE